jgi:large subunit ribosomal protein L34
MSITYQPKNKKRYTTHGFLVRMKSKTGKKIINSRRASGRAKLSAD